MSIKFKLFNINSNYYKRIEWLSEQGKCTEASKYVSWIDAITVKEYSIEAANVLFLMIKKIFRLFTIIFYYLLPLTYEV